MYSLLLSAFLFILLESLLRSQYMASYCIMVSDYSCSIRLFKINYYFKYLSDYNVEWTIFQTRRIGNIEYRLMTQFDYDEVVNLTCDAFIDNPSVMSCLKLNKKEVAIFYQALRNQLFKQPLSLVAQDIESKVIAGVKLSTDYNAKYNSYDFNAISHNIYYMLAGLEKTRNKLLKDNIVPREQSKVYHLLSAAVHKQYSGQGIIRKLSEFNIELAQQLGFQYLLSESASPLIQHIYQTQGYRCVHFESFSKYTNDFDFISLTSNFRNGFEPGIKHMLKQLTQRLL